MLYQTMWAISSIEMTNGLLVDFKASKKPSSSMKSAWTTLAQTPTSRYIYIFMNIGIDHYETPENIDDQRKRICEDIQFQSHLIGSNMMIYYCISNPVVISRGIQAVLIES